MHVYTHLPTCIEKSKYWLLIFRASKPAEDVNDCEAVQSMLTSQMCNFGKN